MPDPPGTPEELLELHELHDLGAAPLGGGGAPRARVLRWLRRRLLGLLGPWLARQSRVNAANARLASRSWSELASYRSRLEELEQRSEARDREAAAALRVLRAEILEQLVELDRSRALLSSEVHTLVARNRREIADARDAIVARIAALAPGRDASEPPRRGE